MRDSAMSIENWLLQWVYVNYADKSQQPLVSHVSGKWEEDEECGGQV